MSELVSIITPCYNAARFIGETIESVLCQSYPHWEMIIVDDCSTDSTVSIVEQYIKRDSRIKLFKLNQNSGPAAARNKAIELSKGRFIAFLDSDDIWLPEKLNKQVRFMLDFDLIISYTAFKKIDENGIIGNKIIQVPREASYKTLLKTNYIPFSSSMIDLSKTGKVYLPNIKIRQDHSFWLKLLKNLGHEDYALWLNTFKVSKETCFARGINEPLILYRTNSSSLSGNKLRAAIYHLLVLIKFGKTSYLKLPYYFFTYAYNGYKKYKTF